jgi:hypothetical protein
VLFGQVSPFAVLFAEGARVSGVAVLLELPEPEGPPATVVPELPSPLPPLEVLEPAEQAAERSANTENVKRDFVMAGA